MDAEQFTDPQFLERLRNRDLLTWEDLVDAYLSQLFRTGHGMGFSLDEAQDLAQPVFLALMERSDKFEARSHIRTFLFGIFCRGAAGVSVNDSPPLTYP